MNKNISQKSIYEMVMVTARKNYYWKNTKTVNYKIGDIVLAMIADEGIPTVIGKIVEEPKIDGYKSVKVKILDWRGPILRHGIDSNKCIYLNDFEIYEVIEGGI